ncbi:TPA: hypothetical protein I9Y23_004742 [Kluyvera ascorbata]|uniref:hypothetical protein n=1 Tax=Kluyvera genomosp. 2 TaxID=2774054 RepID=UPI0011B260B0|nr:hypothetical protein [Kluyvera genomosp. 2]HAT3921024.1 hypothetical protein [Kluyvera ascorbata]HAT3945954.1 hypothetical protein [Kluyvera ascorbata]HAT3951019.1 hypothetical protein [Kluyvera ascorbata]
MKIYISVKNSTSNNYIVHVFDRFASGMREVDGSPFYLSENEISSSFGVNASLNSNGVIMYQCEGGPSIDSIQVNDGEIYEI